MSFWREEQEPDIIAPKPEPYGSGRGNFVTGPHALTWVRKMMIRCVVFGVVDTEQDNWQRKLNKLEESLNLWKSLFLSLLRKGLVVNVLWRSKLIYLARVLVLTERVLSRVSRS